MSEKIKVIQIELGTAGMLITKLLLQKENLELAAMVADIADEKIGMELGKLIGLGRDIGISVSGRD